MSNAGYIAVRVVRVVGVRMADNCAVIGAAAFVSSLKALWSTSVLKSLRVARFLVLKCLQY